MLFHLFSVVKVLYILISGRYEKQNVKTGQIQKRGKVAPPVRLLSHRDCIDQFRIFLCEIKFLKHPAGFFQGRFNIVERIVYSVPFSKVPRISFCSIRICSLFRMCSWISSLKKP